MLLYYLTQLCLWMCRSFSLSVLTYMKDFALVCCKLFLKYQIFIFFQCCNHQSLTKLHLIFFYILIKCLQSNSSRLKLNILQGSTDLDDFNGIWISYIDILLISTLDIDTTLHWHKELNFSRIQLTANQKFPAVSKLLGYMQNIHAASCGPSAFTFHIITLLSTLSFFPIIPAHSICSFH